MDKPTTKGRPLFNPTAHQRSAVAIAAGAGMTHASIALALGINRETLNRHFKLELSTGACAKRIEMTRALYTAAKKGNVAACKAYLLMGAAPAAPREVAKGKRELAALAAEEPVTDPGWAGILQ